MKQAGFSLLEMLLVLMLLGVVLGMLTLATGAGPATRARGVGQGLLQLLQGGRQSALLEGRDYGLRLGPDTARLLRRDASGWHPLGEPLQLGPGLSWQLYAAGLPTDLSSARAGPQIILSSSDEMTPFTLSIEDAQRRWLSIASDGLSEPILDES